MDVKKYLWVLAALMSFSFVTVSCDEKEKEDEEEKKNYWEEYAEWREENIAFFEEKYAETDENGNLVYERITPTWDPDATILMRWLNDRSLNADAMQPYSTSYIDVVYEGKVYNGEVFDDSFELTQHGDSIYRSKLSDNIKGWVIAFTHMHVGDHCELIIPYDCAYGSQYKSDLILPYSLLIFDVKLKGIPGLEKPVY